MQTSRLRARYLYILTFFGRAILSFIYWELALPRIGFRSLTRRTRSQRSRDLAARFRAMAIRMGGHAALRHGVPAATAARLRGAALATPHISASPGDFAETLLLPGDPLRARFIATRLLQGAKEVTNVRNMLGYTGEWRGRRVSVMGSGMGIPSCILYATELYRDFGVRRIVRVGTCGAVSPAVALGDSIVAVTAGKDSAVLRQWGGETVAAGPRVLQAVMALAAQRGVPLHAGPVFSSDFFYHPDPDFVARLTRLSTCFTSMRCG